MGFLSLFLVLTSLSVTNIAFIHGAHLKTFQLSQPNIGDVSAQNSTQLNTSASTAIECARLCTDTAWCQSFVLDETQNKNCLLTSAVNKPELTNQQSGIGNLRHYSKFSSCPADMGYVKRSLTSAIMCVRFMEEEMNYSSAKSMCESIQGHLVIANTREKINEMTSYWAEVKNDDLVLIGVGLTDEETENMFTWADGKNMSSSERELFLKLEPNNGNGGVEEDWVAIYGDGFLDLPMSYAISFVCELSNA